MPLVLLAITATWLIIPTLIVVWPRGAESGRQHAVLTPTHPLVPDEVLDSHAMDETTFPMRWVELERIANVELRREEALDAYHSELHNGCEFGPELTELRIARRLFRTYGSSFDQIEAR